MSKPILATIMGSVLALLVSFGGPAKEKSSAPREEFFIISSIDAPKSRLVLKRPAEVTAVMVVNAKTSYWNERGRRIPLSDLRAGDTVWVSSTQDGEDARLALRIRKGPMTVEELHRLYLDFPQLR